MIYSSLSGNYFPSVGDYLCDNHTEKFAKKGAEAISTEKLVICRYPLCNKFAKWVINDLSHYNPYSD